MGVKFTNRCHAPIGFDLEKTTNDSFGLSGMQERCDRHNGHLSIDSSLGTKITITIPSKTISGRGKTSVADRKFGFPHLSFFLLSVLIFI